MQTAHHPSLFMIHSSDMHTKHVLPSSIKLNWFVLPPSQLISCPKCGCVFFLCHFVFIHSLLLLCALASTSTGKDDTIPLLGVFLVELSRVVSVDEAVARALDGVY